MNTMEDNNTLLLEPEQFPKLLKEIPDLPKQLYLKGKLPGDDTKFLCVVGSRKYSPYGKEVCEELISGLSGYKIAIVSGLALGIDSIAHRAALSAGLKTIAIPGSGLNENVLYPSSHRMLAKKIVESGGALISEFEPDEEATVYTFPQRNRVMAGMSHAILVIEAVEKSGTLITARLALDYNRDVLTVPGSIFSKNSYGPHTLIRLGSTPITTSDDILLALNINAVEKKQISQDSLSKNEQAVLKLLDSPLERDTLISELNMKISEANILISTMEIKGLLVERLGEIHAAK